MSIGFWQIAIVVILVVLLFGRGKISSLMGDVAKGIKSFKKGMSSDASDVYTVTVDEHSVSYTAQADDTIIDIRAGLIGAVNADSSLGSFVEAGSGATSNTLTLTTLSSDAGTAFQVNTYTQDHQQEPAIAALSNSRFITTWTSSGQDGLSLIHI